MTETKKINIQAGNIVIEAYQDEEGLILLTHRQIGEVVGKSKAVAQRFLKQRENELPSTIKASIPSRKGKIALTQWQSAKMFWQSQAEKGNQIAVDLINAIRDIPSTDLKVTIEFDNIIASKEKSRTIGNKGSIDITEKGETQFVSNTDNLNATNSKLNHLQETSSSKDCLTKDSTTVLTGDRSKQEKDVTISNSDRSEDDLRISNPDRSADKNDKFGTGNNMGEGEVNEVKLIAEGIEVASNWMVEAGIDEKAVAAWKLTELGKQIPVLAGVVNSALETITSETSSPTGMIVSQLAKELSAKLGTKVTPAKVNQALHDLELQEWAKPGVNRERKLTGEGKKYGIALLTTSADGWQGAQLRWYDSVVPLLCNYFSASSD